jgi:hypothetical protein
MLDVIPGPVGENREPGIARQWCNNYWIQNPALRAGPE